MFKNVCFFCPPKMSICLKYNRDSENAIKVIEANKRGNHNGYTRKDKDASQIAAFDKKNLSHFANKKVSH